MFILRNSEILHLILLFLAVLTQNFAVFIYAHKYNFRFSFFFNHKIEARKQSLTYLVVYLPKDLFGFKWSKQWLRCNAIR